MLGPSSFLSLPLFTQSKNELSSTSLQTHVRKNNARHASQASELDRRHSMRRRRVPTARERRQFVFFRLPPPAAHQPFLLVFFSPLRPTMRKSLRSTMPADRNACLFRRRTMRKSSNHRSCACRKRASVPSSDRPKRRLVPACRSFFLCFPCFAVRAATPFSPAAPSSAAPLPFTVPNTLRPLCAFPFPSFAINNKRCFS
ncbi:hypothetical protein TRVL_06595 [Trypanosoma vivax]|nr:hypothetical protein TRVL_06595 [Trypanosoma vivax]